MNYILVRSPKELIKNHRVGYGWASVNFSNYRTFDELIESGFEGKDLGRKRNQIQRYFHLKAGDIVVVPLSRFVVFAEVVGTKSFVQGVRYGENQIQVNYLRNDNGEVYYYPRSELEHPLQKRLRIRMSIANLKDFEDSLSKIVADLKQNKIYLSSNEISEKQEQVAIDFKQQLESRLRTGKKIWIESGGQGLEKLVAEIFQANGYDAMVQAKNGVSGIADVDVVAKRINILTGDVEGTLIQAKHHKGTTHLHGIEQLVAYPVAPDEYDTHRKVLVTTASSVSKEARQLSENNNIKVVLGDELASWIYDNVDKLSEITLRKLGVITEPSLI